MVARYDSFPPRTAPLVSAAQQAGLPFEASATGRWIRLSGQSGIAYIVQDAWSDGCLLMQIGEENGQLEHFLNPQSAVLAAAQQVGLSVTRSLVTQATIFGEVG
ncbi:MAG: hypothetical protein ACYC1C_18045 [Chloroflexota bacterium]